MTKSPLAIVAALAVLAGCNDDRAASSDASADTTTTYQTETPASQPRVAEPETTVGQGAGWTSRSTVDASNSDGGFGSDNASAGMSSGSLGTPSDASATTTVPSDVGADATHAPVTSPAADDDKRDGQRGSTITEDGANDLSVDRSPQGTSSGSLSANDASSDRSAQQDAHRSTHAGEAGGTSSGIVRPELPNDDTATIGADADDRALVSRIRQAIVDDETLSYNARAVQVRSESGRVLLLGTVPSEREAARISSLAFRESGGRLVVNQLEIAGK